MKHTIKFAALVLGLASVAGVHAQGYVGASISRVNVDVSGLSNAKPSAISLKLGSQSHPNFAVEARLGAGLSDDSINGGDLKLNNYYGLYAKGILPVTNEFAAYALGGYTRGKVTLSTPTGSASDTDGDLSYGLGVDFSLSKNTALNLEWARLFKGSVSSRDYKVDALSFGVNYRF